MTLVLHEGRIEANPLRIGQKSLDDLLRPYEGSVVFVHFICEDRFVSWTGKGTIRPHLTKGWCLHQEKETDPLGSYEPIPFFSGMGFLCSLSVVPEPSSASSQEADELINQARALADLLNKARRT